MRVVITTAAKADLIAIGDFIKPNNPERAVKTRFDRPSFCREFAHTTGLKPLPLLVHSRQFGHFVEG
jgi:plasmid stabilization system protein ParE